MWLKTRSPWTNELRLVDLKKCSEIYIVPFVENGEVKYCDIEAFMDDSEDPELTVARVPSVKLANSIIEAIFEAIEEDNKTLDIAGFLEEVNKK